MKTKRERASGATLIEVLIAVLVFSFLVGSVFAIYHVGETNWNVTVLRGDLQNEGRRAAALMEKDLQSTDYLSIDTSEGNTITTVDGITNVARDAICMVGVNDWTNAQNFDATLGLPIWDEWIAYVATKEGATGGAASYQGTGSGPTGALGDGRFLRIAISLNNTGTPNPLDPFLSGTTPLLPAGQPQFDDYYPGSCTNLADTVWSQGNKSVDKIKAVIQASLPNSPPEAGLTVQPLSSVFAFSVHECDSSINPNCLAPSIGITFKTRKSTHAVQEGNNSTRYESFQINMVLQPQANHSF